MTAYLAQLFNSQKKDPSEKGTFFDEDELKLIRDYINERECNDPKFPPSCDVNLFFGFFFDGTNNNLSSEESIESHASSSRRTITATSTGWKKRLPMGAVQSMPMY
jgi:hypothetical protein